MKLMATITPEQMDLLYPSIDSEDWAEVFEEEYIFYNPSDSQLVIMALLGIVTYKDIPDEAYKYIKQSKE